MYLNRQQKEQVLLIAAMQTYIQDLAETWEKLKQKQLKPRIKWAKSASTFAQKVLEEILGGVDKYQARRIIQDINKYDIVVKYKDEAVREYKKMQQLDSVTPVVTDDLYEIVDNALYYCIHKCQKSGKEISNCTKRKILLKYDIPVLDPKGECPYKGGVRDAKNKNNNRT